MAAWQLISCSSLRDAVHCDGVQRFLAQSVGPRRRAQYRYVDLHMLTAQCGMPFWRPTPVLQRQQRQQRCHVPPPQACWRIMQRQQPLCGPWLVPWRALLLQGRRERLRGVHQRNWVPNVLQGKLCAMQRHQQVHPEWRRLQCESVRGRATGKATRWGGHVCAQLGEPRGGGRFASGFV